MRRWLLAAVLLALCPSARAQTATPDPSAPPPYTDAPKAQTASEQGVGSMITIGPPGGAAATSLTIDPSKGTIMINTPGGKGPLAPVSTPRSDVGMPMLIGALLMIAAAAMFRARREAPPAPTAEIPSFTIVRVIGEGGMGTVYEAVERALDRKVAVKRLRGNSAKDDVAAIQNLVKEAKTVAALHHPNIVDIHSVTSQGGEYYLVFELLEGRTVEDLLKERGRLPLKEARMILDPVCRALEFAHARGVVHRDLKPANVMITTHGQVKVMDFGIARRLQAAPSPAPGPAPQPFNGAMTNNFSGTPIYSAPEAVYGRIVPQSDVYSLGIMAYRILGGALPYSLQAAGTDAYEKRYTPLSQLAPEISPSVDALIAEALEPEPSKRLASPALFRERLAAAT